MTWSVFNKVSKSFSKFCLTISWDYMCDKIKTSHVGAWLVSKGISAKIPKTNYLFIDYHNFIIRVIP